MDTMLIVDNYDSFTFNLVQLFSRFDLNIFVHRNDRITLSQVSNLCPDYIVISPGPKDPIHAGISIEVIAHFHNYIPLLGVCLGMQCINHFFSGSTLRSPTPVHGKTSLIYHRGSVLLANIPSPFQAARYHSLHCELAKNSKLQITARCEEGLIMGLAHPDFKLFGVQFHPESFLTQYGYRIAENFLNSRKR